MSFSHHLIITIRFQTELIVINIISGGSYSMDFQRVKKSLIGRSYYFSERTKCDVPFLLSLKIWCQNLESRSWEKKCKLDILQEL